MNHSMSAFKLSKGSHPMSMAQRELFDTTNCAADFKLDPIFSTLWPTDEQSIASIRANMRKHGFDKCRPLLLGIGPWTDKPVLLDGHVRLKVANQLGIVNIPSVTKHFSTWAEAAEEVVRTQSFQQWREPDLSFRYEWLNKGRACVCNMKRTEDRELILWAKERNLFVYVGRQNRSHGLIPKWSQWSPGCSGNG